VAYALDFFYPLASESKWKNKESDHSDDELTFFMPDFPPVSPHLMTFKAPSSIINIPTPMSTHGRIRPPPSFSDTFSMIE
jgi:hypothetical protein